MVNGQIFEADRDFFRFTAEAGQTLVCAAEARAILPFMADAVPGWCDACLTLRDANGKELAYVDDFHLKPDPVLIYTVAKDGDYLLEIRTYLSRPGQLRLPAENRRVAVHHRHLPARRAARLDQGVQLKA